MKNIYLIVGESGSGKTTIVNALEQNGLKSIQSYTTRPPRTRNEKGHIFVTEQQFDTLHNMVGYTEFNGYRYCATADQVEDNDLYVIDPSGVFYFLKNYHGTKGVKAIYIKASRKECMKRMLKRGDSFFKTLQRLHHDKIKFGIAEEIADKIVCNNDLREAILATTKYILECEGGGCSETSSGD